jgi:hypothetical protein
MRKEFAIGKSGIFALGYIENDSSYLNEISRLAGVTITALDLDRNINDAYDNQKELNYYYDNNGNLQSGEFDEKRTCLYAIDTGYTAISANPIYPREPIFAVFARISMEAGREQDSLQNLSWKSIIMPIEWGT